MRLSQGNLGQDAFGGRKRSVSMISDAVPLPCDVIRLGIRSITDFSELASFSSLGVCDAIHFLCGARMVVLVDARRLWFRRFLEGQSQTGQ